MYKHIDIAQDGVWAGRGLLRRDGGQAFIDECLARLGPDGLDHESGEEQEYTERVYEAIEGAIEAGQDRLTLDGIEYTWTITPPEIEVIGLGENDWTFEEDREWQRYGTVLVRIEGLSQKVGEPRWVEYEVGVCIGVPEYLITTAKAAGGDTHTPYLSAWYVDESDWRGAPRTDGVATGIPAGLDQDVLGAIEDAARRLWREHEEARRADID